MSSQESETESEDEDVSVSSPPQKDKQEKQELSGWAQERMNYLEMELTNLVKRYTALTSSMMTRHSFDCEYLLERQGFPAWIPPTLTKVKDKYYLYEQSRVLKRIVDARRKIEESRENLKREEERIEELRQRQESMRTMLAPIATTAAIPPVSMATTTKTLSNLASLNELITNVDKPVLFETNRPPDSNVWCVPGALPASTNTEKKGTRGRKRRKSISSLDDGEISKRDMGSIKACVKRMVERVVILDRKRERKERWKLQKERKQKEQEKRKRKREQELRERRKQKEKEEKIRKEKRLREEKLRLEKRKQRSLEEAKKKILKKEIEPVMRSMLKHIVEGNKRGSYCLLKCVLLGVFDADETLTLRFKGHEAKCVLRSDGLLETKDQHVFKSVSEWLEHVRLTTKIPLPKTLECVTKNTLPVGWGIETYERSGKVSTYDIYVHPDGEQRFRSITEVNRYCGLFSLSLSHTHTHSLSPCSTITHTTQSLDSLDEARMETRDGM